MAFINVAAAAAITLAGVQLPTTLEIAGEPLALASCGVRDTLWIDHYAAGLYLPPGAPIVQAKSQQTAKAVRMQVIGAAWLPSDIPEKWRRALASELEREPMSRVRRAYRNLDDGDVVTFSYAPQRGVTMSVNGRPVVQEPGHEVIDAILDAWAERDAISGKLQRLAMRHPCQG